MKVHYPKLYNMVHISLNVFTASKGSNNYILFIEIKLRSYEKTLYYLSYEILSIGLLSMVSAQQRIINNDPP